MHVHKATRAASLDPVAAAKLQASKECTTELTALARFLCCKRLQLRSPVKQAG